MIHENDYIHMSLNIQQVCLAISFSDLGPNLHSSLLDLTPVCLSRSQGCMSLQGKLPEVPGVKVYLVSWWDFSHNLDVSYMSALSRRCTKAYTETVYNQENGTEYAGIIWSCMKLVQDLTIQKSRWKPKCLARPKHLYCATGGKFIQWQMQ